MAHKGETWNESETYRDPWTLRPVRRVTTRGLYNQSPNYHTNIGFSADGEFLIFASAREDGSAIFRRHMPSRDITEFIPSLVPGHPDVLAVKRSTWAYHVFADGSAACVCR